MTVSYEIMTQYKGKWTSESITADKDDAISRAEESFARGRVRAVKVIEETFDESTGDSREKIVFNRVRKDHPKKKATQKKSPKDDEGSVDGKKKPRRSLTDLLIIIFLGFVSIIASTGLVICVISR